MVCPLKFRGKVFTSAAVDNIDHNPSSTTSKDSFHGTSISLFQHPSSAGEGNDRCIIIIGETRTKAIRDLPHYYTDVPSVAVGIKRSWYLQMNHSLLKDEEYESKWRMNTGG